MHGECGVPVHVMFLERERVQGKWYMPELYSWRLYSCVLCVHDQTPGHPQGA